MNNFLIDQMPWFMQSLIHWINTKPIIPALLILVILDWLSGVCRACITKSLSSSISWRGMVRKVFMLLLIGVAAVLQPFAGGLPLTELVALAFVVVESLSIVENAAASGIPIPRALADVLAKLKEESEKKRLPLVPSPPVEQHTDVHVNIPPGTPSTHTQVVVNERETRPDREKREKREQNE
jgi:toxin secretion/phage lysis holin